MLVILGLLQLATSTFKGELHIFTSCMLYERDVLPRAVSCILGAEPGK